MAKYLSTLLFLSIGATVACSDTTEENPANDGGTADARLASPPDAALFDARPAVFACTNQAVPDPVLIAGQVEDLIGGSAASGVSFEVFPTGSEDSVASVVSDPDGNYSLSLATGGTPWTGEIRATSDDYIDMHIYPSGLFENSENLDMPALTEEARSLASLLADVTIEPNDALVLGYIYDCNDDGIEGATITTDLESGDLLYLLSESPYVDSAVSSTTSSGTAIVLNAVANTATPGKAKLSAAYGDRTWEVTVDVIPGELAIAIFMPYALP